MALSQEAGLQQLQASLSRAFAFRTGASVGNLACTVADIADILIRLFQNGLKLVQGCVVTFLSTKGVTVKLHCAFYLLFFDLN